MRMRDRQAVCDDEQPNHMALAMFCFENLFDEFADHDTLFN